MHFIFINLFSNQVRRLPKTRSGKILRKTLQSIANVEPWTIPPTTEDSSVFPEIVLSMQNNNIIPKKE